jgi:hypothetical protein
MTAWANLASSPATLTDALDVALTRGQMPPALKQTILTAVTYENGGNLRRVQTGLFLLATSGYYNVWH